MGSTGLSAQFYDKENLSKLKRLMASSGFLWSNDQLIDYIAKSLTRKDEEQIFVEEDKVFVGCNLFMSSTACINGRIEPIRWSHSTYIQNNYRRKYGLDMVLRSYEYRNVFGFGLTEISGMIHKRLGSCFLNPSFAYVMKINHSYSSIRSNNLNDALEIDYNVFKKISCANDIIYPQDGMWNRKNLSVDFVRDANFIQKRFFDSPYDYSIYGISTPYSHDRLYFVTRIRTVKRERCLFLVDYRYSLDDQDAFQIILSALESIAKKNNIEKCFIFSSLKLSLTSFGENITRYGEPCAIVTNNKELSDTNVFITPADSDNELIPFERNNYLFYNN